MASRELILIEIQPMTKVVSLFDLTSQFGSFFVLVPTTIFSSIHFLGISGALSPISFRQGEANWCELGHNGVANGPG